jgi:hypothetical protein
MYIQLKMWNVFNKRSLNLGERLGRSFELEGVRIIATSPRGFGVWWRGRF